MAAYWSRSSWNGCYPHKYCISALSKCWIKRFPISARAFKKFLMKSWFHAVSISIAENSPYGAPNTKVFLLMILVSVLFFLSSWSLTVTSLPESWFGMVRKFSSCGWAWCIRSCLNPWFSFPPEGIKIIFYPEGSTSSLHIIYFSLLFCLTSLVRLYLSV